MFKKKKKKTSKQVLLSVRVRFSCTWLSRWD